LPHFAQNIGVSGRFYFAIVRRWAVGLGAVAGYCADFGLLQECGSLERITYTGKEQATAKAKCWGLSTTPASAPPPVEMRSVWVGFEGEQATAKSKGNNGSRRQGYLPV
jgi:hypothetical protein